jgi:L-ascorbate metabolism protein UlaG (beta-lactamase superfamily)
MRTRFLLAGFLAFLTLPATGGRMLSAADEVKITPVVHASFQVEYAGKVVQVDPWSIGDLSALKPADLILITDSPDHHLDPKAIKQLRKPGAPIVMPATAKEQVPDGIVLPNGQQTTVAGIKVESIAAYDITGVPAHPKGEANGYLMTIGDKRIYIAGVTECAPEVKAIQNPDIAFMPMNIPDGRMKPQAAADCTKIIHPKVVYLTHYDQGYTGYLRNPKAARRAPEGGLTIPQTVAMFRDALKGSGIEFRDAAWYPAY